MRDHWGEKKSTHVISSVFCHPARTGISDLKHIHRSLNQNQANVLASPLTGLCSVSPETEMSLKVIIITVWVMLRDCRLALPRALSIHHTNINHNEAEEEAENPGAKTCIHTYQRSQPCFDSRMAEIIKKDGGRPCLILNDAGGRSCWNIIYYIHIYIQGEFGQWNFWWVYDLQMFHKLKYSTACLPRKKSV